jgi:hypothetical protein
VAHWALRVYGAAAGHRQLWAPSARRSTQSSGLPWCAQHRVEEVEPHRLWCEVVALACELLAWTRLLALTGTARRWEPKRLRLRLLAVAGRLARSGRRLRLRLAARWPWAGEITTAVTRLQALPSG